MAQSNVRANHPVAPPPRTHEGGVAKRNKTPLDELQRTVTTCLLWEDNFYENGVSVAKRIQTLVPQVEAHEVMTMAAALRHDHGLRHVPLLLVREMARGNAGQRANVAEALNVVIRRADEIAEFLSLYWATNDGKKSLPAQVKKGLSAVFNKFDEHQLAKWDKKDAPVRLRDAMFLSHAKPFNSSGRRTRVERKETGRAVSAETSQLTEQERLYEKVAFDELKQSDTWEDRLSSGEDKATVFRDLMQKGQLGGLAFIRNLRKMTEVGITKAELEAYAGVVKQWGILTHQFVTAARVNPHLEDVIDKMMLRALDDLNGVKLAGRTLLLVDVSGSMDDPLVKPKKAQVGRRTTDSPTRVDAAAGLAIYARETCESVRVVTFSNSVVEVPARRGLALRDAIDKSQKHGGTYLARALDEVNKRFEYDRIIVITDEQSADGIMVVKDGTKGYVMNVASAQHGVGTGKWHTISGWSPHLLRYIAQVENPR